MTRIPPLDLLSDFEAFPRPFWEEEPANKIGRIKLETLPDNKANIILELMVGSLLSFDI